MIRAILGFMFWAIFGVAVAVFGALTAWLVKTRADRGFMLTSKGEPIRFAKKDLPLLVVGDPESLPEEDWIDAIKFACDLWNRETGSTLFVEAGMLGSITSGGAVVTIEGSSDPALDGSSHASVRFDAATGRILAAPIVVNMNTPAEKRRRVVAHELGHVLGLDHDDSFGSVMYGRAIDGEFKILEGDVKRLREWYA